MDSNLIETICQDAVPNFLGLFDMTVGPSLLFYAYIPAIVIVLLVGFSVLFRDKFSKKSVGFFFIGLFFSAWIINEMIQWTAVYHEIILVSWKFSIVLESFFFASIVWTIYLYFTKSKFLKRFAIINSFIPIITLFLVDAPINVLSYDSINCEGVPGSIWFFVYGYQIVSALIILWFGHRLALCEVDGKQHIVKKNIIYTLGSLILVFISTLILSDALGYYEINLAIPIAMIAALEYLGFISIEYPVFSFRVFRSEILVYTTIALVGSLLLVPDISSRRIIIVFTLLVLFLLGRVVLTINKRESEQRDKLEVLNMKLKELDATKNEFLSFATHQLRSPLTSLKWGLNAVADAVKGNPASEPVVAQLRETADNMINTVNDLLDISKIEQGGLVMTNESIDLVEMVEHLAEEFRITAEKKGLGIHFSTPLATASVSGDKTKLRQVLVNVVDNAIKYTASGTVTLSVSENTPTTFCASVTDTGAGISKEESEKLFTKFARGTAGKTATGGSGLGLYLAKKIMELHHGDISVTSSGVGHGSTFTITLPKNIS